MNKPYYQKFLDWFKEPYNFIVVLSFILGFLNAGSTIIMDQLYLEISKFSDSTSSIEKTFETLGFYKSVFFTIVTFLSPWFAKILNSASLLYFIYCFLQIFVFSSLSLTYYVFTNMNYYKVSKNTLIFVLILVQFLHKASIGLRDAGRVLIASSSETEKKNQTKEQSFKNFIEKIRFRKFLSTFCDTLGSFFLYSCVGEPQENFQRYFTIYFSFYLLVFLITIGYQYFYKFSTVDTSKINLNYEGILKEINKFFLIKKSTFYFLISIIPYALIAGMEKNYFYLKAISNVEEIIDWNKISAMKSTIKTFVTIISMIVLVLEYFYSIEPIYVFILGVLVQWIGLVSFSFAKEYEKIIYYLISYSCMSIFPVLTINSIQGVLFILAENSTQMSYINYQLSVAVIYMCLALGPAIFNLINENFSNLNSVLIWTILLSGNFIVSYIYLTEMIYNKE